MDKTALLAGFFDAVWIQNQPEKAASFFAPEGTAEGVLTDFTFGPEDMATWARAVLRIVTDMRVEIIKTIESGDWLTAIVRFRAVTRARGAPVDVVGHVTIEADENGILSAYNSFDMAALFVQIGALPPDIVERALNGETLR